MWIKRTTGKTRMTLVKPILVTGAPRSGTTWVGNMLAASSQLYYIHEPFNPDYRPGLGICNVKFGCHQTYITEADEGRYYKPIRRMIEGKYNLFAGVLGCRSIGDLKKVWEQKQEFQEHRRQNRFPLIKDPIALMSAGWLARRFDINVVVMIRHPAAFVSSMKRLDWGFHPSRWALTQNLLLKDYLSPLEDELKRLRDSKADIVEQTALLWKVAYLVVSKYKEQYPNWIYLRHEDLSRDPLLGYEQLYKRLGLEFTDRVKEKIVEYSNESNPSHSSGVENLLKLNSKKVISQWKKALSPEEIARIKDIIGEVSSHFYSDRDWE
jgi:hypothetical protein